MERIENVMIALLGPSWRTSIIGIATILGAITDILLNWANKTMPDLRADAVAFWSGIGLIFAKDRSVSNAGNPVPARKVAPEPPPVEHE